MRRPRPTKVLSRQERRKIKREYNYLRHLSFKIVPLYNYTHLPATVVVLATFLEAILWKPFQLLRRILNDMSHFSAAFSRGNR